MTLTLSVTDNSIDLVQLLQRARQGEEIVIIEDGQPVARFVLMGRGSSMRRVPGTAKGQLWMADDFDAPLPDEIQEAFEA